jgi:hypothetical protein
VALGQSEAVHLRAKDGQAAKALAALGVKGLSSAERFLSRFLKGYFQ